MVKLIAKTHKIGNEGLNPLQLVAYIARVSSFSEDKTSNYKKLVNYLIENKHWSPFEHYYYSFEIKTSRAIGTQLLRHRSLTFQQFSQRYEDNIEFEHVELRKQSSNNRQSSTEVIPPDKDNIDWYDNIELHHAQCRHFYYELIAGGVARECARSVLPESTSTIIIATGNLRSWFSYLNVRLHKTAQKEHVLIAREIAKLLIAEMPELSEFIDIDKSFDNFLM